MDNTTMTGNNTQDTDSRSESAENISGRNESTSTRALEESLKSTFGILKYVMLVLLVAFCLSGLYFVEEGTVVVHTRFGRIVNVQQDGVIGPGGPYFAFPSPIDKVISIPTTLQKIDLQNVFWTFNEEPLLTGDKNIVHAKWSATFRVQHNAANEPNRIAPFLFVKNIGSMENSRIVIGNVLEQAVVQIVCQSRVEDFYQGKISTSAVKHLAQQSLDRLQSGITLTSVALRDRTVPEEVSGDFQAVNRAESEKASKIESAQQMRTKTMNRVAGSGYPVLLNSLKDYEKAKKNGDDKTIRDIETTINDLLLSDEVGGEVAATIQNAKTYHTTTVQSLRGAAGSFEEMLTLYKKNPDLYKHRQVHDSLERIFRGDIKSYYLPADDDKTLYLEID